MFFCISFRLDRFDPPRTRRYFEGEFEDRDSAISALVEHAVSLYPHDDTLFNYNTPKLVILSCSEYLSCFK